MLRIEYHIDCNKKHCATKWKDRIIVTFLDEQRYAPRDCCHANILEIGGGNLHTDLSMYQTLKTRTFLRSSFTRGFILFARDAQKDKCVGGYGVQEKTARFIASTWQKFNNVPP